MTTETRVGAFILAGLVVLAGIILKLSDVTTQRTYPLSVSFRDVAGLPDKSVVKLSGVEVGKVRKIVLEGARAIVKVRINEGIQIFKDAHFRVGSTSIIGSKFLQIDQGHASAGVIERGSSVMGEDTEPLERLMADALKSVQDLLGDLKGSVGKHAPLMENLTASVKNMREMTANMNDLMADVKPHLEKSLERSEAISAKLDQLLARTNDLMAKLNSSTGTVGALVSDPAMKDEVKETVTNLRDASVSAKDILGRFGQYRVYWNFTARNEPAARATKGDAGLRIVPRPGRYYYIGASNLGSTSNTALGVDYEQKNTIDALLGFDGDWWDVFGGAVRSSFGVGARLRPFYWDPILGRLSFFAQGYDFGRNRTILGRSFDKPVYDAGIEAQIHRFVTIGARVQDIAEVRRYETTANLSFEDKDVAYLFGLVTFAGSGAKSQAH
jgi:phospholipid/cholesterol/gamma-HCH transport system substrate-binding protein